MLAIYTVMRSKETELVYFYLFVDLAILNFSLLFLGWIDLDIQLRNYQSMSMYILHGNLAWIISYFVFSKKNLFLHGRFYRRFVRITKRHLVYIVIAAALEFFVMQDSFSRTFFFQYSAMFYALKISLYFFVYKYLAHRRRNGTRTIRSLIVGCNETGEILKRILNNNASLGYKFIGFACHTNDNHFDLLGSSENLEQIIDEHNIQMVFYTFSFFKDEHELLKRERILKLCNEKGVRLRLVPQRQSWFKANAKMESIGHLVVLNPQQIPMDNASNQVLKRFFDIAFSGLVILFILSWLYPLLTIIIKIGSKGPALFIQERTGINNRTFRCLKFRSMKVNGDANTKQACANDARITPIGHFMRKTNLDEMPQFINVFRGDMSVVGPRPHMLKHTEQYSELIGHYLVRHYVKPGITGWAQVRGFRGETRELSAMEKRVEADMEYIDNWKLILDIKIIWLTIFGKKAYSNAG